MEVLLSGGYVGGDGCGDSATELDDEFEPIDGDKAMGPGASIWDLERFRPRPPEVGLEGYGRKRFWVDRLPEVDDGSTWPSVRRGRVVSIGWVPSAGEGEEPAGESASSPSPR